MAVLTIFIPNWRPELYDNSLFFGGKGMKKVSFGLAFLALCVSSARAGDETIGIRGRMWFDELSGDVQASTTTSTGTVIDVENVLDIGEAEKPANQLELWIQPPLIPIRFVVGAWTTHFKEQTRLNTTINFGGTTFATGTDVETDIDIEAYSGTVEYYFSSPELIGTGVEFGIGLGADYYAIEAEITGGGATETQAVRGPLPKLGVRLLVKVIEMLEFEANVTGMSSAGFGDVDVSYIDGYVEGRFRYGGGFVGVGYRLVTLDGEDERDPDNTNEIDIDIKGVYITAGFVW